VSHPEANTELDGAARSGEGGGQTQRLDLANRLALRPKEAAETLGIGERTLRALLPQLPVVREGAVVLIPVDLLREWLRKRAEEQGNRIDEAVREILEKIEE